MNRMNVADVFGDLPALETERLRLRRIEPDDTGVIFAYCFDPEVARYTSWAPRAPPDETRGVVAAWVEGYRRGRVTAGEHEARPGHSRLAAWTRSGSTAIYSVLIVFLMVVKPTL